jgi:hypothetical protein
MIAEPFLFLFLIYPKHLPNGGSIKEVAEYKTLPLPLIKQHSFCKFVIPSLGFVL